MTYIWLDLPWKQCEGNALGNGSYKQLAFHEGEIITDADAEASSKGNIRVSNELFFTFWYEALGIERFRIWEVFGALKAACIKRPLVQS